MIRRVAAVALLCALPLSTGIAGELDLSGGAWIYGISGTLDNQGDRLDLQSDLHLAGRSPGTFSVAYFPQAGWWPVIEADYQRIAASGSAVITSTTRFGPIVLTRNDDVASSVAVNDIGLSLDLPFRLLDVDWGAGVLVKRLYGHARVIDQTTGERSDYRVDETFPMAHLRARAQVLSWLRLEGSGGLIAYQGSRVSQWRLGVALQLGPFALTAGYQERHYVTDSGGDHLDAHVRGPTAGVELPIR